MSQDKLQKLQMIEQSLTNLLMQRQQFQAQLVEVESALGEIEKTDEVYKIVGNIMIKSKKDELKDELSKKKEKTAIRINSIQKQEKEIKEKAKKLQSEVLANMEGE